MKDPTRHLKNLSQEARRRLIEGAVQSSAPPITIGAIVLPIVLGMAAVIIAAVVIKLAYLWWGV